ncbi:hypothetical protein WBG78_28365 [Chryseolinea sp. T2]|uniref:hypothetical protein n=1 Tax=Chryseolinea sp. T2 TaxID=3129255 RepID=UPI0030783D7E
MTLQNSNPLANLFVRYFSNIQGTHLIEMQYQYATADAILILSGTTKLVEHKDRNNSCIHYDSALLEKQKFDSLSAVNKLLGMDLLFVMEYPEVVMLYSLSPNPDHYDWFELKCPADKNQTYEKDKIVTYLPYSQARIISKKTWREVDFQVFHEWWTVQKEKASLEVLQWASQQN